MEHEQDNHIEETNKQEDNDSLPLEYDNFDVEFEIPLFTVRRNVDNDSRKIKDYEMNIPMLVKHILELKLGDGFGKPISAFGIYFKTVLIYGRAVPLGIRSKKDVRLYTVDDGTGSIVVHYPHSGRKENINTLSSVNKLEYELDIAKRNGLPFFDCYMKKTRSKECKELITSMEVIMKKIKKQTYFPDTFFKHGVKVSVVGIPFKTNRTGEIHLYAQEMIEDSDVSRDKELFFKRNLIRFYRNNFK